METSKLVGCLVLFALVIIGLIYYLTPPTHPVPIVVAKPIPITASTTVPSISLSPGIAVQTLKDMMKNKIYLMQKSKKYVSIVTDKRFGIPWLAVQGVWVQVNSSISTPTTLQLFIETNLKTAISSIKYTFTLSGSDIVVKINTTVKDSTGKILSSVDTDDTLVKISDNQPSNLPSGVDRVPEPPPIKYSTSIISNMEGKMFRVYIPMELVDTNTIIRVINGKIEMRLPDNQWAPWKNGNEDLSTGVIGFDTITFPSNMVITRENSEIVMLLPAGDPFYGVRKIGTLIPI